MANRLDLLGVDHSGVSWRRESDRRYLEVGLDPYSEDTAARIRLICEPVEVRFVHGPTRPDWDFPDVDDF